MKSIRESVVTKLYEEVSGTAPEADKAFNVKMTGRRGGAPVSQDFDISIRSSSPEAAKSQAITAAQKQGYADLDIKSVELVPDTDWWDKNNLGSGEDFHNDDASDVLAGKVGLDKVSKTATETPKTGANNDEPGYRAAIVGHK